MWTKCDFENYLREELGWSKWTIKPTYKNLTDGVLKEDGDVMYFGDLRFLGHNADKLGGYIGDNLVKSPEEIITPNWTVTTVKGTDPPYTSTIQKDTIENPYGIQNAEGVQVVGGTAQQTIITFEQSNDLFEVNDYVISAHFKCSDLCSVNFIMAKGSTINQSGQIQLNVLGEQGAAFVEQIGDWYRVSYKFTGEFRDLLIKLTDPTPSAPTLVYGAFGFSVVQTTEFEPYYIENVPKPRVANYTKVDGITMTLDSQRIIAKEVKDETGMAVFHGFRAQRVE